MWATERYYDLLGSVFHVRSQHGPTGGEVDRLLAGFGRHRGGVPGRRRFSLVAAGDEGGRGNRLYHDCRVLTSSASWDHLTRWLLSELNRAAVDGFVGFAAHAGVVAAGQEVIAFPAPSGGGKSTLTAACLKAGFAYVSDEALCVDFGTALVLPYAKPLALSAWSRAAVGLAGGFGASAGDAAAGADGDDEAPVLAPELGAGAAAGDLRLAHVVRLVRSVGPPRLHELPRSEVLAQLLGMSFNHYKWPERAFRLVTRLAQGARAWQLDTGGEPLLAAALLRERLAPESGLTAGWGRAATG